MSAEEQKTIESLRRKRGNTKATLTRLELYYQNITAETSSEDIGIRLELLERAYNDFKDIDDRLIIYPQQNSELPDFENRYCILKAKFRAESSARNNIFHEMHQQFSSTMQTFVQQQKEYFDALQDRSFAFTSHRDEIKLPKITIPPFSGNYEEFPSFKDLFEATIHNNDTLSKVHKFKYLKGLLCGEAANIVKHVTITDANYETTWDKIVKRYDHKDHIMTNLIRQFLQQPRIHGSSKEIRQMADTSDEVLRGLSALGDGAKTRDGWLIYLLLDKCDEETRKSWALKDNHSEFPTIDAFISFLNDHSNALERAETTPTRKPIKVSPSTNISVAASCPLLCNEQHLLHKCNKFLALDVISRRGLIAEKKLCFCCMKGSHRSQNCKSKFKCMKCGRKHNTLLHTDEIQKSSQTVLNQLVEDHPHEVTHSPSVSHVESTVNCLTSLNIQAILPTALVRIKDGLGQSRLVRALLDSGSQASFIDEDCFNKLNLKKGSARVVISGLASSGVITKGVATIEIISRFNNNPIQAEIFILEKLPIVLPSACIKNNELEFIRGLELADPNFNKSSKIDMLLGADIFFNILRNGKRTSPNSAMIAQNTAFGYVVSGRTNNPNNYFLNHITITEESKLDEALKRFWEIEEVPITKGLSEEEIEAENHFSKHVRRNNEGRFVVRLPFKCSEKSKLGNSAYIATKRFYNLEKKLRINNELSIEYKKFMTEYSQLQHMEEILPNNTQLTGNKCFHLPHHAVVKTSSSTTKVRVVFDGSCRSSTGISLNDVLMVGPTIQSSLWDILLRFRTHKYVMTADIEKMYRQILVCHKDADYQRILWREDPNCTLKEYKLITVTYGTASAPFLATRCLHQLALDNMNHNDDAANIIRDDFYVDDLLTGCDSTDKMLKLKTEISTILKSAGFELRKWNSNLKAINENIPCVEIRDENDAIKILGLQWFPQHDYFSYKVQDMTINKITKRSMLSDASKIFDPLGWLSPSTIAVKIMFQQLWLQKLSWDDQLPENIKNDYLKLRSEFQYFEELKISRWIQCSGTVEFHVFVDASEKAYAAAVFCRTITSNNHISVRLVTAKTKVTPIKQKSLPRLELCAAVLGTNLLMAVSTSMKHLEHTIFAWTDSSIVLSWLSDHPSRWTCFVGNRTSQILSSCPREKWSHVKSSENPADVATRGILPSQLCKHKLWWQGPDWLSQPNSMWKMQNGVIDEIDQSAIKLEKRKKNVVVLQAQTNPTFITELITRCSSYSRLLRIIAFVIRFIKNFMSRRLKNQELAKHDPYLSAEELSQAEAVLIKDVQITDFKEDIKRLRDGLMLLKHSSLKSLNPFLDKQGILRVGGRLEKSACKFETKHPIILHKSSILSKIVVTYFHNKFLHPGPSLTFHLLRQRFWVINGRSTVNQIVRGCVTCARYRGQSPSQLMGQIPRVRINHARPFENTGVDFTGAVLLANKRGRGAKLSKGYIAIFICLVTKAIHIEIVTDCSTDVFIAALRRFIGRRGLPANMYSDNGTNFVGTDRKLRRMYKAARTYTNELQNLMSSNQFMLDIGNFLSQNQIVWHYTPPLAPHFAGIWESAVKSVKSHLAKATGNINFTYEELSTLLCNIEAILNSRPLTVSSTNDDSYEVLTPGHFLIGAPITSLPEPYEEEGAVKFSKMWTTIQQRTFTFWKRFNIEYLHNLQQRNKWKSEKPNVRVGDIVLIKEQFLPPCKWALGRISKVHPGEDGHVRVVTISTASSTFKRPLNKIVLLPIEEIKAETP